MTVTNSQSMDELFRAHEKDEARQDSTQQASLEKRSRTEAAWREFQSTILRVKVDAFIQHVTQSGGRVVTSGDSKNWVIVELYSLFDRGIASGASLTFSVNPEEGSFSAKTLVGGGRERFESIHPRDASQQWVVRWFDFLLTDFRKNAK